MSTKKVLPVSRSTGVPPLQGGFEVSSPCGRKWFVPLTAVFNDYVDFLRSADGLTLKQARKCAQEERDALDTWFHEQFQWADIDRCGVLIKEASASKVNEALDFYRNFSEAHPSQGAKKRKNFPASGSAIPKVTLAK